MRIRRGASGNLRFTAGMLLLLLALSFAVAQSGHRDSRQSVPVRVFAPYADVGSIENLSEVAHDSGARALIVAFLTTGRHPCELRWAGFLPVSRDHDLAAQVSDLQRDGIEVTVAFGGEVGKEAAQTCQNQLSLQNAYQAVIDKYHVRRLDFDIEAKAISDMASINRRDIVLRKLQKANPGLAISFTLAATPDGLTPEGVALLKDAARNGLDVDPVNIMAMNYGETAPSKNMGANAIRAAQNSAAQIRSIGLGHTGLGVTVMVGRNNIKHEIFTPEDARKLVAFARAHPEIKLLSMWSLGRDRACPGNGASVSPTCSGIQQERFEFAHIFEKF